MKILVTAGNTLTPIDRVRCITNVFTGKTGGQIALEAQRRGHDLTLLTSHPEVIGELAAAAPAERWLVERYRTFEDLQRLLEGRMKSGGFEAVLHAAAVSDYRAAGIFAPAEFTRFRDDGHWESSVPELPRLVDRAAGKVKSDQPELWLRLVRTPKLVDFFRGEWGFTGILVKFKLEVGIDDIELVEIAERSRLQSQADLMVANTLEGSGECAYVGPLEGGSYRRVPRRELAARLLDAVEVLQQKRTEEK